LIAEGHTVLCVDNLITGSESNIAHLRSKPTFRFIRHDITKPLEVKERLDYVLHFASPASPSDFLRYPIQTLKVGSVGTLNALGIAKAHRAKFLLASTSEVYGDPQVHPQPETYWGHVNPIGPRGVYDEAKRCAEALTMAYHHEHGVDARVARIFNTYGPRIRIEDGRAIPAFMAQALRQEPLTVFGDGSQTRSFCYVDDMIDGLIRLMRSDYGQPVNLGNPEEHTILGLAHCVLEVTRSPSQIVHRDLPEDDPKQRCPDITVARRVLSWEPKTPLREGLRKAVDWFAGQINGALPPGGSRG
jgi:dTDP-glucose 4,6-dehydratase